MPDSRVRPILGLSILAVLLAVGGASGATAFESPEDLLGDWYVLVHYRDSGAEDPQQPLWDDEIWRIAPSGGRLSWTLYPHVALRDDEGRFETLPSGVEARTTVHWSPSPSQLTEIRGALQLDDHESRTKSLRGSSQAGWRSAEATRAASASMIAYQESWSIRGPAGARELVRQVVFEAARTDRLEGRTVYTIRESRDGGDEFTGDYSRDGREVGEFRMLRIQLPKGTPR